MKVGDSVKIIKCEQCPTVVGKIVPVSKLNMEDEQMVSVELNFGRGRPQKNRPTTFFADEVELMDINVTAVISDVE